MTDDDARARAQAFVRDVDAALAGLPRERREELTGDLVDHLLEPNEDGRRPIDDGLDSRAYATELLATTPLAGVRRVRSRTPYVAGAALLGLVVAAGVWLGLTQPWSSDTALPQAAFTPSASPSPVQVSVPDVRGLTAADAVNALSSVGLSTELLILGPEADPLPGTAYLESGVVATTDPFARTRVDEGSTVLLMLTP
jgi:hypothetical protein